MSLSQKDKELVDKHARRIVDKGLGTMAILMVDSMKPLSYIGSQLLHIANPILTIFPYFKDFDRIAELLEDSENIEYFLTRIEFLLNEKKELEKKTLKNAKKEKKLLDKSNDGVKHE